MFTYFCMLIVKREMTVFRYKYSKGLDVPVYVHLHIITRNFWERSGSVLKCISRDGPIAGSSLICVTALLVQTLISVQALVFDLVQLTCQKRFDCRNAILGSSAILLGTSYS